MRTTERINRHRNDSDALDFETLRTDAIKLVQELCGDNWTDYNLHDPGVTILEQLCYALTDLAYRSGFSIQDYLAGKNGVIDYEKQALYPPYDILPSSAITQLDYEKIIYDAIPEIDHIWLKPFQCGEDASIGLFTAYININQDLLQSRTEAVVEPGQIEKTTEQIIRLLEHLHRIYTVTDQITGKMP